MYSILRQIRQRTLIIHLNDCATRGPMSTCSVTVPEHDHKPSRYIFDNLRRARSQTQVLDTVKCNFSNMNSEHLVEALKCLSLTQKNIKNIFEDPVFKELCQRLKKNARNLNVSQTVTAIEGLACQKISVKTYIFQILLQMIRCNINMLENRHIVILDPVVTNFASKSHLAKAIKSALPLVFENNFLVEFNRGDLFQLKIIFKYSWQNNLSDIYKDRIVDALLLHKERITIYLASYIVNILCKYENNISDGRRSQLLKVCFDVIVQDIRYLDHKHMLNTLWALEHAITEKDKAFYHQPVMDAFANNAIAKRSNFKEALNVALSLSHMGHIHSKLASYVCDRATEAPERSLLDNKLRRLLVFCLKRNNYIPKQELWEILRPQVYNTLPYKEYLIHLCLDFACLNHYEDELLQIVFSEDYLFGSIPDYVIPKLLTLGEAVKKYHYVKYELPETILKTGRRLASKIYSHPDVTLVKNSLVQGLGGNEYIRTNVMTPSGYIVEAFACFGENNRLLKWSVNVDQSNDLSEEYLGNKIADPASLPRGTTPVCIKIFKEDCYGKNVKRLFANLALRLNLLESDGYAVIVLNASTWLSMPESERIPYFIRELSFILMKRQQLQKFVLLQF